MTADGYLSLSYGVSQNTYGTGGRIWHPRRRTRRIRLSMNHPTVQGTWLAWGIGIPADLFDGYMCSHVSVYDEDLIAMIRERDPEWPPPNDDVEDLDDLNDSWATEVSGITEQKVQEQVSAYPDEVRGVIRIR
jgi:hypothetical protein